MGSGGGDEEVNGEEMGWNGCEKEKKVEENYSMKRVTKKMD